MLHELQLKGGIKFVRDKINLKEEKVNHLFSFIK